MLCSGSENEVRLLDFTKVNAQLRERVPYTTQFKDEHTTEAEATWLGLMGEGINYTLPKGQKLYVDVIDGLALASFFYEGTGPMPLDTFSLELGQWEYI